MNKITEETVVVSNPNNNQGTLYAIIIILLIIIAIGWFFLGMKLWESNAPVAAVPLNTWTVWVIADDLTVTIYDDARCTDCQTNVIIEQLQAVPVLANAEFIIKDFSDDGVSAFLESNSVTALPAAVFSSNWVWSELAQYLTPLDSGEYSLALWASHNPFVERSANGFLVADDSVLKELQETAYIEWIENAKITWIEYTDVNCHYCKKMKTDGTAETVLAELWADLNKTTSNFIGVWWANTQTAAEILECSWKLWGADAFNAILSTVLTTGDNSEATMLALATEQWLNSDDVKACLDSGETKDIVAQKFSTGAEQFWITWTPWNVLINNETGEYEVVSGAYPADKFIETANKLLGNL